MNRAPVARRLFIAVAVLLFGGSALGIFLTGPVVVRVQHVELGVSTSPQRLTDDVRTLCEQFGPRDAGHLENLERAAQWIATRLAESGLAVEFQEYRIGERTFRNVLALKKGLSASAGVAIVGAHYDAPEGSAGAEDNASGVAVLLELARTFADTVLPRDCYLVAFGTGAPPNFGRDGQGSRHFAGLLAERKTPVDLMLALDRVGYVRAEALGSVWPAIALRVLYAGQGQFTVVLGDPHAGPWIERVKHGMRAVDHGTVESLRAPAWLAPVDLSDHASFRRLGFPGVQVTDRAFLHDPAGQRRPDDPDRLDYPRMAQLVVALHGVLREGPAVIPD